jgi:outer membrane protein TolC
VPLQAATIAFPAPVNSFSFTAGLIVPVSDYVLRTSQTYASASHSEKSKRLELAATALQAGADGRAAFYNWLRAKGQVIVAADAVSQVKAHLEEANRTLRAGLISPADVVRLEAQVAAAEQGVAEVEAFAAVTEQQLRTAIHQPEGQPLVNGANVLEAPPPAEPPALEVLVQQAMNRRLEIRALDETEYAFKDTESAQKAGYLPRVDAFADAIYANPNPRIFPAEEKFDLTWDLGLRATFVLNDVGTAAAQAAETRARVASVAEQRGVLRDGLRLEVASAYYELKRVVSSIAAAERQIASATESSRVRNELFKNGKATGVELIDAETELTRSRLNLLDIRFGVLVAEARLAHATGADVGAGEP